MDKTRIKFDPLKEEYKTVRGAVELSRTVTFNIEIACDFLESGLSIRIFDYSTHVCRQHVKMLKTEGSEEGYNRYTADIAFNETGVYYYLFQLEGVRYESWIGVTEERTPGLYYDNPIGWQQSVYKREYKVPEWTYGGVMYHIFVDRFYNVGGFLSHREGAVLRPDWGNQPEYRPDPVTGEILNNDFFGGNLQGVIAKLEYLSTLNVSMIILSPIFEAYSNHKYDTGDYMKIDEMFGSEEDYIELCREAGKHGIRIILDGVFNHTGADSIYFDRYNRYKSGGAYVKKDSKYAHWYNFTHWNERYSCWWDFKNLPVLNGDNEEVREFFCGEKGVVRKWLGLGASGWRLDVVDELNKGMLERVVRAAKEEKEDSIIIGEVWEDASNKYAYGKLREYFQGKELDSVMNYPLRKAIITFIREGDASRLHKVNFDLQNNYPQHVVNALMNILGTHDTARIITELGGDPMSGASREAKSRARLSFEEYQTGKKRVKLAAVLQYTLSGFPCLYYGDEAGVQGCNDPFNRTCFPWNSADMEMTVFYRLLGEIRREGVFKEGIFREIEYKEGYYCFSRESDEEKIIVAVNRSEKEKKVDFRGNYAVDLLSGEKWRDQAAVQKDQAVILKLEKAE